MSARDHKRIAGEHGMPAANHSNQEAAALMVAARDRQLVSLTRDEREVIRHALSLTSMQEPVSVGSLDRRTAARARRLIAEELLRTKFTEE